MSLSNFRTGMLKLNRTPLPQSGSLSALAEKMCITPARCGK
jgi:hypothetical protein